MGHFVSWTVFCLGSIWAWAVSWWAVLYGIYLGSRYTQMHIFFLVYIYCIPIHIHLYCLLLYCIYVSDYEVVSSCTVLYNKRWKIDPLSAKTVFTVIKLQEGVWAVTAYAFLSILFTEQTDRGRKGTSRLHRRLSRNRGKFPIQYRNYYLYVSFNCSGAVWTTEAISLLGLNKLFYAFNKILWRQRCPVDVAQGPAPWGRSPPGWPGPSWRSPCCCCWYCRYGWFWCCCCCCWPVSAWLKINLVFSAATGASFVRKRFYLNTRKNFNKFPVK